MAKRWRVGQMTYIWIKYEGVERVCVSSPLGDPITLCGFAGWGLDAQESRESGPATCDQCLTIVRYCQAAPSV